MKYLSILKYVLVGFSFLTVILFFVGATDVDLMLRWTYVLLAATLATAIIFPLVNMFQNPKAALRTLIGLAIVAVVCGIGYALGNDNPVTTAGGDVYSNSALLKVTDMGLYVTYIAFAGALLAIVIGEVRNALK